MSSIITGFYGAPFVKILFILLHLVFELIYNKFVQCPMSDVYIIFIKTMSNIYISEISDLLYITKQRWRPRGRPWPRERPRGHMLKSLASKP